MFKNALIESTTLSPFVCVCKNALIDSYYAELICLCVPYGVGVVHSHLFLLPVLTPSLGNGTQFGRQDQCISEVTSQVVMRAIAIDL